MAYLAPIRARSALRPRSTPTMPHMPRGGISLEGMQEFLTLRKAYEEGLKQQDEYAVNEENRQQEHDAKMAEYDAMIAEGRAHIRSLMVPAKGDKGEPAPHVDIEQLRQDVMSQMPSKDEIVRSVVIPKPKNGADKYEVAKEVLALIGIPDDGKDANETDIMQKLLEKLKDGNSFKIEHVGGLQQTLDALARQTREKGYVHGGGITRLTAGTNITITKLSDGSYRITAAGGGSGVTPSTEKLTPTASGSNITLDLTALAHTFTTITGVYKNGQLLDAADPLYGWSRSSNTITVIAGTTDDIFYVAYNY